MAKATKLPSGNYRCLASRTVNGIRQRKSFTAETKKEAERLAAAWEGDRDRAVKDMPLGAAIDAYIDIKSNVLSPSTVKGYINLRNNAYAHIIDKSINNITDIDIQYTINAFAGTHSSKSVRNAYGLLGAVLKTYRPGFTFRATLPQKEKARLYIPSEADVKNILQAAHGSALFLPLQLAVFGGLRAGEICALTAADFVGNVVTVNKSMVCDVKGVWHIKPPKSFAGDRRIVLPEQIQINGTGKITQYNPHSLSQAYRDFLRKNGFRLHRFHDLRHFYVSELFDMGVPEKYIIAQVGHSTASITRRVYDHISTERQADFAEQIKAKFAAF